MAPVGFTGFGQADASESELVHGGVAPSTAAVLSAATDTAKVTSMTIMELSGDINVKKNIVEAVTRAVADDADEEVLASDLGMLTEDEFLGIANGLSKDDGTPLNPIGRAAAPRLYRSAKLLVTKAGLGDHPVLP